MNSKSQAERPRNGFYSLCDGHVGQIRVQTFGSRCVLCLHAAAAGVSVRSTISWHNVIAPAAGEATAVDYDDDFAEKSSDLHWL